MALSKRSPNKEDVESVVDSCFEELDDSHCKQGVVTIEPLWKKWVELKIDYINDSRFFLFLLSGTCVLNAFRHLCTVI